MPTYSAVGIATKPMFMGEFGNASKVEGQVTPSSAVATGDVVRPLIIPAGTRVTDIILQWASQGSTAPADIGYAPVDPNAGSLVADPDAFKAALAMATANDGAVLAGFDPIKFEQDVFLTITFGTVVTGAAGRVRAVVNGQAEGIK